MLKALKAYLATLLSLFIFSCQHQEKVATKILEENPYYLRAYDFLGKNISDSSFIYFNKAKEKFLKDGDSVKIAKCFINMAIISGGRGDFFGSQELSLAAIKYLNPNIQEQREVLSSNYNNLGKMAYSLKNYPQATQFYLKSIEFTNEEASRNIYLNNIAVNLTDQKEYASALKYFKQLLESKSIKQNPVTFSRILSNNAKTRWLQNPANNPLPDFLKALAIRQRGNDLWGQNASFAHLADFYLDKKPDSALYYAHRMLNIAQDIESADDKAYALERLIKLSEARQSRQYFEAYVKLEDSLETDRNAAKNQFAMIRYETEKNKTENLRLQRDNAENKYEIIKHKTRFTVAILLFTGILIIARLWYNKRRQKLALEAEAAIRNNELKIHKKVHDVVANGLYTVMSEIENKKDFDKDHILDKIEALYEQSRDITYDRSPITEINFAEKINDLMTSFSTENRRVLLVGNEDEFWRSVTAQAKHEIEHVLQELMVNMDKHSGASTVVVKFERIENHVNIYYTDDGVGIKGTPNFKNGLTNTGNRIQGIGGKIIFGANNQMGLKVQISFPIT